MSYVKKFTIALSTFVVLLCSNTTAAAAAPAVPDPATASATATGALDPADGYPITEAPVGIASGGESCSNIGNGDVCIRVNGNNGQLGDITVWFSKHTGNPVTVKLRYARIGEFGEDDGAFTISAGEVRGYTWPSRYLTTGCYYGQLRTGTAPNYATVITGGSVCL
jgi:hypothetical protein